MGPADTDPRPGSADRGTGGHAGGGRDRTASRDDLPDQHVAEEIRRGYRLRERLLRPALVRVAHNPKQTAE